jgi:hypothetical protein
MGITSYTSESQKEKLFTSMMQPSALNKANLFLKEEREQVESILLSKKGDISNILVIGGGPLTYIDLARKYGCKHICINPFLFTYLNDNKEIDCLSENCDELISDKFEDIAPNQLLRKNSLYVFHFNVISYIDDVVEKLDWLAKTGEMIVISTWLDDEFSRRIKKEYFKEVGSKCTADWKPDCLGISQKSIHKIKRTVSMTTCINVSA